jgi:dienelactone hydrolase
MPPRLQAVAILIVQALLCPALRGQDLEGMARYLERLRGRYAEGLNPDRAALRQAIGYQQPAKFTAAAEESLAARGQTRGRVLLLSRGGQAAALAERGFEVAMPALLDTNGRDRLYRIGFPFARHPLGLETEVAVGALEWLVARRPPLPIGIWADAEGALVAECAAALFPGFDWLHVEGGPVDWSRLDLRPWHENVFGLVRDLGPQGPGRFIPPPKRRAVPLPGSLSVAPRVRTPEPWQAELLALLPTAEKTRARTFQPQETAKRFREEVLGVLPPENTDPAPQLRQTYRGASWVGWDVTLRVRKEFVATGVLLLPDRAAAADRFPIIVVQHGLEGRPQDLFQQDAGRSFDTYRNYAEVLVRKGFAVFLPQNPYRGDFRRLVKLANPLGLSLFSLIRAQYQVIVDWLATRPEIDITRLGFYGLSYGGKTALRVPVFDSRFRVVVCAGDFNEWVRKLVDPSLPYSYLYTQEYDVLEWGLANVASHGELAQLMAPRPFLVERGHRDGVGEDEWVAYEFAKVRRYYDEHRAAGLAGITFFNGPHRIDGEEALRWFERHLRVGSE